jgi:transcriptional regulator with XRE-family HTH domain
MINNRIKLIIKEFCKGNDSAFARAIGVTPSVIGNITGARAGSPSFEVLQKIINAFEYINIEWLLIGKGDMLRSEEPTAQQPDVVKPPPEDSSNFIDKITQQAEQIGALKNENEHKDKIIRKLSTETEHLKNENKELRNDIREYRIEIAKFQGYPEAPVREMAELMRDLNMGTSA